MILLSFHCRQLECSSLRYRVDSGCNYYDISWCSLVSLVVHEAIVLVTADLNIALIVHDLIAAAILIRVLSLRSTSKRSSVFSEKLLELLLFLLFFYFREVRTAIDGCKFKKRLRSVYSGLILGLLQ